MISGRRVLCGASPHLGHAIPTAALALEFQRAGNDVAVVTDLGSLEEFYRRLGLSCIDIRTYSSSTRQAISMMLSLLSDFDPDITICDWRRDLWIAQQCMPPRCRISILRCENFVGYVRRSPFLPNKYVLNSPEERECLRLFNQVPVLDPRLLYKTEVIVVPSMPEFDPPPPNMTRDYPNSVFVYTGPLFVDAFDTASASLQQWIAKQRQKGRPVVLVTTGTAWGYEFCLRLAEAMDRVRFSCVLAVPKEANQDDVEKHSHPHLLVVKGARLSELMSLSDAVVHHCGHGTYQAVILAGKPSITIPSFEYDREDSALRLEDLGCSIHLNDGLYRRGLNVEQLNDAVDRILSDGKFTDSAARLSFKLTEFLAERGPSYLLRILEEQNMVAPRRRQCAVRQAQRSYSVPRFPLFRLVGKALRYRMAEMARKVRNHAVLKSPRRKRISRVMPSE